MYFSGLVWNSLAELFSISGDYLTGLQLSLSFNFHLDHGPV